jgi:FADH2 O2-dependent halogenase
VISAKPDGNDRWQVELEYVNGERSTVSVGFLVDAGGRTAALANHVGAKSIPFADYPDTVALYSHFDGVALAEASPQFGAPDTAPYPIDWSALHHVFPGGWMWILRFDDNRVSAGVSVERWLADEVSLFEDGGWDRLLARMPAVKEQFSGAKRVLPWMMADPLPVRLDRVAGLMDGSSWAFLPSAAAFIDPLYSTGFSLTLLGIERLAPLLLSENFDANDLANYDAAVQRDITCVARYISANFAAFSDFQRFTDVSMFYFAAASWSEICRRIGKRELAPGMLLSGDSAFWQAFADYLDGKCSAAEAIAPWNIAGLADGRKAGMYPANLSDIVNAANKLGLTQSEMQTIVDEADWARCD